VNPITINSRWREEIVAASDAGKLVFEFTIGRFNVYFPDEANWQAAAPTWAKDMRPQFLEACELWCKKQRYPISVVGGAQFYEER